MRKILHTLENIDNITHLSIDTNTHNILNILEIDNELLDLIEYL